MAPLIHVILVCSSALVLTLACIRAENSSAVSVNTAPPPPTFADTGMLDLDAQSDEALSGTRQRDRASRSADGQLSQLSAPEHMQRAAVYDSNRAFDEAREHWDAVIARFPADPNVPAAMFLKGRSFFRVRRYDEALPVFEKLGNDYPQAEAGRDGFYYVAATLLRLGRALEASARYTEYLRRFPEGERVENAYLNVIDSLREAGRPDEALAWVASTREQFAGTVTDTNALFARLRLDVSRGDWPAAIRTAEELSRASLSRGVGTNQAEVNYLRAYSLERAGRKEEASRIYQIIPDSPGSYYGGLATVRLQGLGGEAKQAGNARASRVGVAIAAARGDYPAPFRETILSAVRGKRVDPRLVLAIMRQESGFRANAKSNSAARGLMQFTIDTAKVYAPRAKLINLREEDLYRPEVSIRLAAEYLDELFRMFPNLPEAVAASYNGGEDNVARWVKRAGQTDNGVFTSEIGFSESKDYAAKVMANYRAYRQLYTEDLRPRR